MKWGVDPSVAPWLTDKTLPLIPQPLLPQVEKGSKTIAGVFKAPLPLWERGLG